MDHARYHNIREEELWILRADGTSFWGRMVVSRVQNTEENLTGFALTIRDVTKEKADQEELKAAKFAAEAANHAKTAFLANISHEIRTPLGAVLGFAELMANNNKTPAQRQELYARIRRNGEQLTSLINDLLDIAKAEAGKMHIEKIELDLPNFLIDLQKSLSVKAAEKGIFLSNVIETELPKRICTDPTRLRQILFNLIGNSIKFTPTGGHVVLRTSMGYQGDLDTLVFRVEDSGLGMTAEQIARLFRPFAQADSSTTRKFGGTGLGLFVSKKLATSLGGNLLVETSVPGQGSTFLATIDPGPVLGCATFASLIEDAAPNELYAGKSNHLRDRRILVVDDQKDNRDLMRQFLEQAGATVETAENGKSGVELALSQPFSLVLMDLQMPVLDGVHALRAIRKFQKAIPIFAISAHVMQHQREDAIAEGFDRFLGKPISGCDFIATLTQFFDERAEDE